MCFVSGQLVVTGASEDLSTALNALAPIIGPKSGSGTPPGGSTGNIQVNNGGAFGPLSPTGCGAGLYANGINLNGVAQGCTNPVTVLEGQNTLFATSAAAAGGQTLYANWQFSQGNCTISNGGHNVVCPTGTFASGDVGKLAFAYQFGASPAAYECPETTIASFTSSTTVALTGTCSANDTIANFKWGNDDNPAWTAIDTAMNAALLIGQACVEIPPGMTNIRQAHLLPNGSGTPGEAGTFPLCVKYLGRLTVEIEPGMAWSGCVAGCWASTAQGTSYGPGPQPGLIEGFVLDGSELASGTGVCSVGGGVNVLFSGQTESHLIGVEGVCPGVANVTGITLDNEAQHFNIQCIDTGVLCIGTQGSNDIAPIEIEGGLCSQASNGADCLHVNTSLNTHHFIFGTGLAQGQYQAFILGGTWHSTDDTINKTAFEPIAATGGQAWFEHDVFATNTGHDVIVAASPAVIHVRDSIVNTVTGQKAFNNDTASGTIYDDGGNQIAGGGTVGDTLCVSSTGACGYSQYGEVTVAAAATTVTVATKMVTANSRIQVYEDSTLSTPLGVTCNAATNIGAPTITTITSGTSFVITVPTTPAVNPACLRWTILNPGQ